MNGVQQAEALLLKLPIAGSFLVRKSDKEANTNVISLVLDGKVYHNKVRWGLWCLSLCNIDVHQIVYNPKNKSWAATAVPLQLHHTVADLLCYHMVAANGLQYQLVRPCVRPDAAARDATSA